MKKKDLIILIPLSILTITIILGILTSPLPEPEIIIQTECEEGWFKYQTQAGTLCSRNQLTDEQVQKEFENYGK